MCSSEDLNVFSVYIIKYRENFDKLSNNMLAGFGRNKDNQQAKNKIYQYMSTFTKDPKFKLKLDNIFDVFAQLFIICDRSCMSINSYSILNLIISKNLFNKFDLADIALKQQLIDILDFLKIKYADTFPLLSIDEFVFDDAEDTERSDDEAHDAAGGRDTETRSGDDPEIILPTPTPTSSATAGPDTLSISSRESDVPSLSTAATANDTNATLKLIIEELRQTKEANKQFQTKVIGELEKLKKSNDKHVDFSAEVLVQYEHECDSLLTQLIRTQASISAFELHKEKNSAPKSLDYLRFPKPILLHDSEYINEYNDFLTTLQILTIDFNIKYFRKKETQIVNEILKFKEKIKPHIQNIDEYINKRRKLQENSLKREVKNKIDKCNDVKLTRYTVQPKSNNNTDRSDAESTSSLGSVAAIDPNTNVASNTNTTSNSKKQKKKNKQKSKKSEQTNESDIQQQLQQPIQQVQHTVQQVLQPIQQVQQPIQQIQQQAQQQIQPLNQTFETRPSLIDTYQPIPVYQQQTNPTNQIMQAQFANNQQLIPMVQKPRQFYQLRYPNQQQSFLRPRYSNNNISRQHNNFRLPTRYYNNNLRPQNSNFPPQPHQNNYN